MSTPGLEMSDDEIALAFMLAHAMAEIVGDVEDGGCDVHAGVGDPMVHPGRDDSSKLSGQDYYAGNDGTQCIDAIKAALSPEEFMGFCKGNVMKYVWRAGKKGSRRADMTKATNYASYAALMPDPDD